MPYLAPTDTTARALIARGMDAPVVMLNLLAFRQTANYDHAPHLAPAGPVTGAEAYARYADGILPLLRATGGEILFEGRGGAWFIGPEADGWDHVLLVRQASVAAFLTFAQDPRAVELGHHRTAALSDSRLLPLTPASRGDDR